jgi:hypothetical protein
MGCLSRSEGYLKGGSVGLVMRGEERAEGVRGPEQLIRINFNSISITG